jgi:hypothetical protein
LLRSRDVPSNSSENANSQPPLGPLARSCLRQGKPSPAPSQPAASLCPMSSRFAHPVHQLASQPIVPCHRRGRPPWLKKSKMLAGEGTACDGGTHGRRPTGRNGIDQSADDRVVIETGCCPYRPPTKEPLTREYASPCGARNPASYCYDESVLCFLPGWLRSAAPPWPWRGAYSHRKSLSEQRSPRVEVKSTLPCRVA